MAYMKDSTGRRLDGFKAISSDEAARSSFPAHAPAGLVGRYDPFASVYNWKPSNTKLLRASIARVRGGGYANHMFIGDSRTDNYMGSTDGFDRRKMWPAEYRAQMQRLLPDLPAITDGLIKIGWNGQIDPRVSTSGSWTNNNDILTTTTNGATITIATTLACTNFDINFTGAAGSWTYAVDGGAATAVTVTQSMHHISITGLANTTHSVVLTSTSTTAASVHSVVAWSSGGGLVLHNVAIYGSKIEPGAATGWGTTNTGSYVRRWYAEQAVRATSLPGYGTAGMPTTGTVPDVVCVMLGVNDIGGAGSPGAATTLIAANIDGLTRIRGRFPGSDFILFLDQAPGPTAGNYWNEWAAAQYTLADTLDIPLVDLYARCGDHATTYANGLVASDRLHSPYRWQKEQARVFAALVAQ